MRALSLVVLLGVAVGLNVWWIDTHLRGMPFSIDAAGYLQRAVRDGDALRSGGISAYVQVIRTPADYQAPLLTAASGLVQGVLGLGLLKLVDLVQVFYVITIVSSYAIARRVLGRRWALLAAIVIACVPAILWTSRDFDLALPAAALFTATLAIQLYAEDFQSLPWAMAWGLALGLASLSRTVVLALLPALVIMAMLRAAHGDQRPRRLANLAAGLLVGIGVAATWYTATGRAVLHYLTSYGYGANSTTSGTAASWFSLGPWTLRAHLIVTQDLFLPLSAALVLSALVGATYAIARWSKARQAGSRVRSPRAANEKLSWLLSKLSTDVGTLTAVFVLCYLALSSERGEGSGFELPIVPALVILMLWLAHHATGKPRLLLAASCLLAAAVSFANQAGWVLPAYSDVVSAKVGSWNLVAFDSRGLLIEYAGQEWGCPAVYPCIRSELTSRATPRDESHNASVNAYLRSWTLPVDAATRFIETFARVHRRVPVVYLSVQDPFFNTNTVALAAQVADGSPLPVGLLTPPTSSTNYRDQFEESRFGEPNFVVEGPLPANATAARFSPDNHQSTVVAALRDDGYERVDSVTLPDHRVLGIWWKNRGSLAPG